MWAALFAWVAGLRASRPSFEDHLTEALEADDRITLRVGSLERAIRTGSEVIRPKAFGNEE